MKGPTSHLSLDCISSVVKMRLAESVGAITRSSMYEVGLRQKVWLKKMRRCQNDLEDLLVMQKTPCCSVSGRCYVLCEVDLEV